MSKTEEAVRVLRHDILNAQLAPSTPLVIANLRIQYGFGWTPLREALSRLEAEKLVVLQPNRGYRVAPVSAASLRDLQRARRTVESALLQAAIATGDDQWEAAIVSAHHLLERAPPPEPGMKEQEIHLWETRHNAFHGALLNCEGMSWLHDFQKQTSDQLHRYHRYLVHDASQRFDQLRRDTPRFRDTLTQTLGIEHHTLLMKAALDRDSERAETLLQDHIGFSLAVYETLFASSEKI